MTSARILKAAATISTGLICGTIAAVAAISFAGMIFSGPLASHVGTGIGIALFSAAAVGIVSALSSHYPGSVSVLHGSTSAILGLMAAAIVRRLPAGISEPEMLATVLASIGLCTALTGGLFVLVGVFRLGKVIRFIPFPVISGFMAGTGWLLIVGAMRLMADGLIDMHGPGAILSAAGALVLLPGIVLALLLLALEKWMRNFSVFPAAILGFIGLFYAAAAVSGTSLDGGPVKALLLVVKTDAPLLHLQIPRQLALVHWPAIAGALPDIGSILLIGILSLLLHASSIELVVERDVDLDAELRSAGAANLVSGLGGGMIGYNSLPYTMIGHSMGTASRWVGIIAALFCAGALVAGTRFTAFIPRPILGGLLLFLGWKLLFEWAVAARKKLPFADWATTILILLVIAGVGFLEGVLVGLIAGIVLFVVNYSKIDVVKNRVTADQYRSNVDRTHSERLVLLTRGRQILILVLQGYIFFGTASSIYQRLQDEVGGNPDVQFVVLDFRRVSGLDFSGVVSFVKMLQLAAQKGFCVIFTQVPESVDTVFRYSEFQIKQNVCTAIFPDLDRGIEFCENELIQSAPKVPPESAGDALPELLGRPFSAGDARRRLMDYLSKRTVSAGTELIRGGDRSRSLFLVESGKVSALLPLENGSTVRLRTMSGGSVVGEIGMYLDLPRTASITAEEETTVYELTEPQLNRMEREAPDIALAFHRAIARLMCRRLVDTNTMLQAVLD